MSAPSLRPYRDEDREAVRQLLTRCFGTDIALLRFENGNPLGPSLRVVATMNDVVVGFNHWQPWRIPGVDATVYQSGASAVDPESRGHGIFLKLLKIGEELAQERGLSCFVGFPNPASLGSFLRAGWTHFASLPLYVYLRPTLSTRPPMPSLPHPLPFADWRYRCAEVESRTVELGDGTRAHAFFRAERRFGVRAIRLLDVLTESGERDLGALATVARALPGPGAVMVRCTTGSCGRLAVRVRRKWDTPAILRAVRDTGTVEGMLRAATFCHGDIDAS